MPIKVIEQPSIFYVEFDDMFGNHWKVGMEEIPDDVLIDLQNNPEKITTDTRIIKYITEIHGPIEGVIETKEEIKLLEEKLHHYAGVIALINTGVLKAYMNALEKMARAEKNSKQH